VPGYVVILRTRCIQRVNVDDYVVEIRQMIQRVVAHLLGDGVPCLYREVGVHRDVHFSAESVTDPPRPHIIATPDTALCS